MTSSVPDANSACPVPLQFKTFSKGYELVLALSNVVMSAAGLSYDKSSCFVTMGQLEQRMTHTPG